MTGQRTYEHPLVQALKVDPAQPPDLRAVQGFVGRSDVADYVRIYRDPQMNTWIDVPAEQVLHLEQKVAPNPLSSDGADVLWLTARNLRKVSVESSAGGARPDLVGQPPVGLRGPAHESGVPARTCPCCGALQQHEDLPPMGGGTGSKWPAS